MSDDIKMMHLDENDSRILDILQIDGRAPASHIASEIGMSVPAVGERIKKLVDSGIIRQFKAVVDPRKVGLDVAALITVISESSANYEKVTENAQNTIEIKECFSTTGRGSHVMLIHTKNTASLEMLLKKIQSWPGVEHTETQLILSSYKKLSTIHITKISGE